MKRLYDFSFLSLLLGIGVLSTVVCGTIAAQEEPIELVDQNGQKVGVEKLKREISPNSKARPNGITADVRMNNGKITIIDHDGTKREIDVSGARNIVVSKSVQSIMENGEEKTKIAGKAIIIGPDGERQEFELSDNFDGFQSDNVQGVFEMLPFKMEMDQRLPGKFMFGTPATAGKYMIGVNCAQVSGQLRSHLDLEDGIGLIIASEPRGDSPAATAGLERHDILMQANGKILSSTEDLIETVQAAGESGNALSLTLIRRGNEIKVDVTPTERKNISVFGRFEPGKLGNQFQFEKVGPGFVFEPGEKMQQDFLKRLEDLDLRIGERLQELDLLREDFKARGPSIPIR